MAFKSANRELATEILKMTVEGYIDRKRRTRTPWRQIARDLFIDTQGKVDVSDVTLIRWHRNWDGVTVVTLPADSSHLLPIGTEITITSTVH